MFERRREVFFSTLINSYNIIVIRLACSRLRDSGGKSFSNKKCEKRAAPFPSRARLNFAFNTFPLRILSESLAQAMNRLNHYLRVINRFSRPLISLSRAEHFRHSSPFA